MRSNDRMDKKPNGEEQMEAISTVAAKAWNYLTTMGIADIVDILIVAFLIYKAIGFVRKTNSYNLAKGLILILIMLGLSDILKLTMINSLLRKNISSFKSLRYTKSCCNDCTILSILKLDTFSKLKFVCCLIINNWYSKSSKSKVNWSFILECCMNCGSCLHIIARIYYNHSWNSSHQCNVLVTLMSSTIFSY